MTSGFCGHFELPQGLESLLKQLPDLPQAGNFIDFVRSSYSWSDFWERMRDAEQITDTFDSIDSCRAKVEELARQWDERPKGTHRDVRDFQTLQRESSRCIICLHKFSNLLVLPGNPDAPRFFQSLLRDSLLLYHAASFEDGNLDDGLWYLLVLRFWDQASLIKEDPEFRESIYDDLMSLHSSSRGANDWLEHARFQVNLAQVSSSQLL